ncbi:CC chemokine-like protein [Turkeypox virus]|uniref:CC chemokine-like protein n=1 Tax=Turkeypox virus TaxID=336486 RepID=A0A0M3PB92_9POXV|nr:CC chemokine-like protein [Turkeypox virus]ALA62410.1 CC chemokine-like protein [Turkeypox virus]
MTVSIFRELLLFFAVIYFVMASNCDFNCCANKRDHEKSKNAHENCKLGCHIQSLSGLFCNITASCRGDEPWSTMSPPPTKSPYDEKRRYNDLNKCIKSCPKVVKLNTQPSRCHDKCCDVLKLPGENRLRDPNACCDGVPHVDVDTVDPGNVLDCMTSNTTCNDRGYKMLLRSNKTVCVDLGSVSPILGANTGYSGGCWGLQGKDAKDPNEHSSVDFLINFYTDD